MLPCAPNFRVDGKRALVTGASRGIGLAAATALAQAGASVTLVARNELELRTACDEINAAGGLADCLVLDVVNSHAVTELLAQKEPFQIHVNNQILKRKNQKPKLYLLLAFGFLLHQMPQ